MWRPSATPRRYIPLQQNRRDEPTKTSPSHGKVTTTPPSTTLFEALKTNPFGSAGITALPSGPHVLNSRTENDSVQSLNDDLRAFAEIYPDVKIEVLRELLLRFDGDSRIHICTEQLIKYKSKWARGQLLNPPRDLDDIIPTEELFRSPLYMTASKKCLSTEFSSLNKSVIDAVLAEVNHSYTRARPVLQGIAAKSWRATFTSLFRRKKERNEVPSFLYDKKDSMDTLRSTGNVELDRELESLFLAEHRNHQRRAADQKDIELAQALNLEEAEEAGALFECQVCYDDVAFESMITCVQDGHTICCECVKRTLHEAIFGQGWAQSVDIPQGTLRCLAPGRIDQCGGHISPQLLRRTIMLDYSGIEIWNKFEQRIATDSIIKSGLPLTTCPFCHYAEVSRSYMSATDTIPWSFRSQRITAPTVILFILAGLILPVTFLFLAITAVLFPGLIQQLFHTSLINLYERAQTKRFHCQNPECSRISCLSCNKAWHDPHTCHEPLILSLRTAVEAARTGALKRTCPRCGTSFIKSSGCNKLTCVCGYAMCYLCRKNIGKVNEGGAVDEREGGEGYRHFCEHFRLVPGQKCTQCSKCDLYMNEDEEISVMRAGEEAERQWREKEGMVNMKGLEQAVGGLGKLKNDDVLFVSAWQRAITGDWTVQQLCDEIVNKLVVIDSQR